MAVREKGVRYGVIKFERRKFPRVRVELPMEYRRLDSGRKRSASAGNASEGGLGIFFPERLEIGDVLEIRLFLSSGSQLVTMDALVEVVWRDIEADEDSGEYRSGVKFVDISEQSMNKLKSFLKDLLR